MKKLYVTFYHKRFLRNFIIYTLMCSLVGFAIGVVVGKLTVEVEATSCSEVETRSIVECEEITPPAPVYVSMGMCKITAYCRENYPHICNNGDSAYTATMTTPTPGRTVAVDPTQIPYGSEVIINGHTYIAEDCGGAIKENRVDILVETHKEALEFGVQYAEVSYITKEND